MAETSSRKHHWEYRVLSNGERSSSWCRDCLVIRGTEKSKACPFPGQHRADRGMCAAAVSGWGGKKTRYRCRKRRRGPDFCARHLDPRPNHVLLCPHERIGDAQIALALKENPLLHIYDPELVSSDAIVWALGEIGGPAKLFRVAEVIGTVSRGQWYSPHSYQLTAAAMFEARLEGRVERITKTTYALVGRHDSDSEFGVEE